MQLIDIIIIVCAFLIIKEVFNLNINIDQLRDLVKIASENKLESLELTDKDITLKIKLPTAPPPPAVNQINMPSQPIPVNIPVSYQPAAQNPVQNGAVQVSPAEETIPEKVAECPKTGHEIKSPMVGVFYTSPSPDAEPYVTVGSKVKKGDVVCIIEAMKLMNEITADKDGEIAEICVDNGQVVEFSQVLFRMKD